MQLGWFDCQFDWICKHLNLCFVQAGATPLMIAAVQGDSTSRVAVVRALLSAKPQPDVNAVNSVRIFFCYSALPYLVFSHCQQNGLVVAQSIIIKGYVRMLDALLSLAPKTDRRVRRPEVPSLAA
jgi:ankyrin repeat protein